MCDPIGSVEYGHEPENGSRTYTNMNSSEHVVDMQYFLLRDTLQNMRWDYIGIRMINSLVIIPIILISVLFFSRSRIPYPMWSIHKISGRMLVDT